MRSKGRKKYKKPSSALTLSTNTNLPGLYGSRRNKRKNILDIDKIKSIDYDKVIRKYRK